MRRVTYAWQDGPLPWDEVAALMRAEPRTLAVLNTKRDTLDLLDALDDPDALHLSTMLCGAHRRQVIAEVKRRLAAGEPCRLVSTQVVEAGVDLDFPLVLRALGPLDGVIQAAGRCNREGLLPAPGRVIVFRPADGRPLPAGNYRTASEVTDGLVAPAQAGANAATGLPLDPDDPATARQYFERLFGTVTTDREGIQDLRRRLDFPKVAQCFRMIDDDTESIVVPFGDESAQAWVQEALAELRRGTSRARTLWRGLQPYLVNVRRREAARYRREGFIAEVTEGLGEWLGVYDPVRGLIAADQEYIG